MGNFKKKKGDKKIYLVQEDFDSVSERLEPGIYNISDVGGMFSRVPAFEPVHTHDSLIRFKAGIIGKVIDDTNKFFSEETKRVYNEMKLSHKLGILFNGKPGVGKTCTCTLIMQELVKEKSAICLIGTAKRLFFVESIISDIRKYQSNPIVIFVDEVDSSIEYDETSYLTFLDGERSVDGLIFIGCTNYLDKIPERIKNRKSRIKYVYTINSLPDEIYREYVKDRIPSMDAKSVETFVHYASEEGLTIDQLKHALIDHRLEGTSIKKSIEEVIKIIV